MDLKQNKDFSEEETSPIMPDFLLMWEDEVVTSVHIGETMVHIDRYILHPVKQIFYKDDITRYEFGGIIRDRCWDENRKDIGKLLSLIGVEEYNPFEICKKTHGRMVQDKIWFKFEGEDLHFCDLKRKEHEP
ncbi:MAG: hypothetical protein J6O55_00510 [Lachnospiraceae bacterium]|nr:hypothetical protein [Lachnospiraceae bacterium]